MQRRKFERQGGSVVCLSNLPCFTDTQREDPRGVQNRGLCAPVYAREGLFIGRRQGLHRFTCVKAAWRNNTLQALYRVAFAKFRVTFRRQYEYVRNKIAPPLKCAY